GEFQRVINETKVNAVRDWPSLNILPEVRNIKVADAFQEEDELEYVEPLDGEVEQVTYVVQQTLCLPKRIIKELIYLSMITNSDDLLVLPSSFSLNLPINYRILDLSSSSLSFGSSAGSDLSLVFYLFGLS
ncbi:hypothetical protein Tco_0898519, partial [Tanacetum coccineum]